MSITRFSFHSPASAYTRPISFRGSDPEEQTTNPLDRIPEPGRFFRKYQPTDKYDPKFNKRLGKLSPADKLKLLQLPNIATSSRTSRQIADSLNLYYSAGEAYELSQSVFPPLDVEASSQTMRSQMKTRRNLATHEAHFKVNAEDLVGKKLLLIGGGQGPLKKELTERNIDCDVTNIDPAFTSLNKDNADHLIPHKFSHPETKKVLRQNQYDEVWALWSLPMYASNRHEVIDFFKDSLKAVSPKQGILRFGPTGRYEYTMDVSGMLREAYIKRLSNTILNVLEARKDLFDVQDFNVKLPNKLWMKSIRVIGEPNATTQYLDQLKTNVLQHEDFIKLSTITEPRLLPSQNTEEKDNHNPWARVKKLLSSR